MPCSLRGGRGPVVPFDLVGVMAPELSTPKPGLKAKLASFEP